MKVKAAIILYILMAFMTNAYCRVHRWDDWVDSRPYARDAPALCTAAATILWPVYWTSRGFLWVFENPPYDCPKPSTTTGTGGN